MFNVDNGFVEALVRGLRSGFLGPEDYRRLGNAETLEDLRAALEETDYGDFMKDEGTLLESTFSKCCFKKLSTEFEYVKAQSVEPCRTILDFISKEKMIDNVLMIVQGILSNKAPQDMKDRLHPIGLFEGITKMTEENFETSSGFEEVFRIFIEDSPIGSYFDEFLLLNAPGEPDKPGLDIASAESALKDTDLEIMKAYLRNKWLQEFHDFVMKIGGTTAEVLGHMLKKEADYRTLQVVLNSLSSGMCAEEMVAWRNRLLPSFGYLFPECHLKLRDHTICGNDVGVRVALEPYEDYVKLFDEVKQYYEQRDDGKESKVTAKAMEDVVYSEKSMLSEMCFEQQFHYGVFYAWVKLREQEIRNIKWIADMVNLKKKDQCDEVVYLFAPRMS